MAENSLNNFFCVLGVFVHYLLSGNKKKIVLFISLVKITIGYKNNKTLD